MKKNYVVDVYQVRIVDAFVDVVIVVLIRNLHLKK